MGPVNGSPETNKAKFETLRNDVCNAFARAAIAMRDASHAAENFSNWFSAVDARNFPASFQGAPLMPYGVPQHQPYAMQEDASNSKKRKADQDEEGTSKKKRTPKEKKPKDKNAPKRAPSAYLLYQNEVRKLVKEQNPTLPNTELLRIISRQWEALPDEKKKPYGERHEKLKEVYEVAKTEYDNKHAAAAGKESVVEKGPLTSKISVPKPKVKPPVEVEEEDNVEQELSAGVASSASSPSASLEASSDDDEAEAEEEEEEEEEVEEETPEPPKKKSKKGAKVSPPPVKSNKDKKKSKKRDS